MPQWTTGIAGVLALLITACSTQAGSDMATVRVSTPTATPAAPTRQPSATPLAASTPTPPELMVSTEQVALGGTILVSVTGDVHSGTVSFLGRTHALTQGARSMYAFVGVGVLDTPGDALLSVDLNTANGSLGHLEDTIVVTDTNWTVDSVTFEPGQAEALLAPDVVAAERALLDSVYGGVTPQKLWDGGWLVPVEGPVTGVFGEQRSINGGAPAGHHGGTDLSANPGTPVKATNAGRVVMAKELAVRGNMIIIDHGGGLFSGYGHLSAFKVTEGQDVAAGELIGEVGSTGLSTGAHLHWEISAGGILVDAWRFADHSNGF